MEITSRDRSAAQTRASGQVVPLSPLFDRFEWHRRGMWHRAGCSMLALDGAQAFPAAPELLFRMIERRRVALHPDLDIRINVSRDRPEPAQLSGCFSILTHAPDLTAILSHDIIKAVFADRGDARLTEDEGHARIVPASTPRWLHLYVASGRMRGRRRDTSSPCGDRSHAYPQCSVSGLKIGEGLTAGLCRF